MVRMVDGEAEVEEEVVEGDQVEVDHHKTADSLECQVCHLCHSHSPNLCRPPPTQNPNFGDLIDHHKIVHLQHWLLPIYRISTSRFQRYGNISLNSEKLPISLWRGNQNELYYHTGPTEKLIRLGNRMLLSLDHVMLKYSGIDLDLDKGMQDNKRWTQVGV
jgi:hypothetical protein